MQLILSWIDGLTEPGETVTKRHEPLILTFEQNTIFRDERIQLRMIEAIVDRMNCLRARIQEKSDGNRLFRRYLYRLQIQGLATVTTKAVYYVVVNTAIATQEWMCSALGLARVQRTNGKIKVTIVMYHYARPFEYSRYLSINGLPNA